MKLATAAMGTRFELVLVADEGRFRPAAEAALFEIEECHRRFSRFAPDSLVAHLARIPGGTWVTLDRAGFELLSDAVRVWRVSGGAFDITMPKPAMASIRLDPVRQAVALEHSGVLLDLGAIAKGHALDLAAAVLRDAGIESAFLHGGTSSAVAIGAPPGTPGWRVAFGPRAGDRSVVLRDLALAVSRTGQATPHPTLDPRDGTPIRARRRVAVVGPSARLCDAWAKAAAVLGARPAGMPPAYELTDLSSPCPAVRLSA